MLAVPQNMGFLACALPIESYSLCNIHGYVTCTLANLLIPGSSRQMTLHKNL
jgi:hypothetical protein